MKFEKIHEDKRGSINRILFNNKEFLVLFTKKGYSRGGDYHQSKQHDTILMGRVECRYLHPPIGGTEHIRTLAAGEIIHFEPNVPHIFITKEDSLIVEWLEGEFEKSYYPEYRRMVENAIEAGETK